MRLYDVATGRLISDAEVLAGSMIDLADDLRAGRVRIERWDDLAAEARAAAQRRKDERESTSDAWADWAEREAGAQVVEVVEQAAPVAEPVIDLTATVRRWLE